MFWLVDGDFTVWLLSATPSCFHPNHTSQRGQDVRFMLSTPTAPNLSALALLSTALKTSLSCHSP